MFQNSSQFSLMSDGFFDIGTRRWISSSAVRFSVGCSRCEVGLRLARLVPQLA